MSMVMTLIWFHCRGRERVRSDEESNAEGPGLGEELGVGLLLMIGVVGVVGVVVEAVDVVVVDGVVVDDDDDGAVGVCV